MLLQLSSVKLSANAGGGLLILIVELVILFFVFVAAIAIVQAVRKVPVQYAKRVIGNKQYGGVRQYIPMKINAAGVMPIIFAQALMLFPMIFSKFDATRGFAAVMSNYTGFWYNFTFAILVVLFTYFYTAVTVNPTMMADDMRKNGGFIPGVKPGKKTAEYLDMIMSSDFPRLYLPRSHRYPPCICNEARNQQPVCKLLRRYFPPDPCGCCSRYSSAD